MKNNLLLILSVLICSGCAVTSQSSIDEVKKEVAKMQIKNSNIEAKQAALYSKYEENVVNVETNTASIQELYKKLSQMSQKISDLEITLKKQKSASSSTSSENVDFQVPSKMYENAYNDFLVGKYEVAMVGFKSFLKQYKEHDLAVQAQYYIAECLYSENKLADAYEEYKKIEEYYPNSEFISSARLKMALCLELLGKKTESIVILQSILQDYPKSAEAFTAKEKIRIYTNAKNK